MNRSSLNIQGAVLLSALVLQYALGMAANLFVSFPEGADEGQLWAFAWSQTLVAAHIILALLILLGAVVLFVRALIRKEGSWILFSLIGLLAVLAAGWGGATFIATQNDTYSYLMSLAFLVAAASYGWGIFASHRETITPLSQ